MEFIDTLPYHLHHPELSYTDYLNKKTLALGETTSLLTKIYLDTKFWINLRNVRMGRSADAPMRALLEILMRLVASGRAICPLSMEIFGEIFRQSDPTTLAFSAKLIDELSQGVCLVEQFERIGIETLHFIRQATKGANAVHPLKNLVWTKTAYVLGHVRPEFTNPDMKRNGLDVAVQKAFLDQMWQTKLADFLAISDGTFRLSDSADISTVLNEGKLANLHAHTSFQNLFLTELRGVLDACRPTLALVMQQIYQRDTGKRLTQTEINVKDLSEGIANLIYGCFQMGRVTDQLPTVRIGASLHAAVRWNSARKFKANDCADFRHAAAAIPYFDYFLTERSLNHLLADGNLKLRDDFSCITLPDANRAIQALTHLDQGE